MFKFGSEKKNEDEDDNKNYKLERVILNPVCNAFENYTMKWDHEPYLTLFNEICWRPVQVPQKAYVMYRDINDLTAYNLKLKK